VTPRDTRRYSAGAKQRFARYPWWRKLHRARLYWTNESRVWPIFHAGLSKFFEAYARFFMRRQVKDPQLLQRLTPDYRIGCKRVLVSNAWFPMFNRPNVELVTDEIREITPRGIVTEDGTERAVDCIVLGTGFVTDPRIYMRDFPITGLAGRQLAEDWRAGAEAYYGVSVHGFPNLHQLLGPNTGLGHNSALFMIECQVHYILQCLRELRERGADYLDVTAGAQAGFNARVQRGLEDTVWSSGCRSWYQQADGRNFTIWPWSTWRYWLETRRVRSGDYCYARRDQSAINRSMCATALAASADNS